MRKSHLAFVTALGASPLACTGTIDEDAPRVPPVSSSAGMPSDPPSNAACAGVSPGSAPIRRLTRIEYNNTVRDLLGDTSAPADGFPADARQFGFDNNADALNVSPDQVEGYLAASERLAATAVGPNLPKLLGCDPSTSGEDACAKTFLHSFGQRAYRRPLTAADEAILTEVYGAGKSASGFKTGIEMALATMLGSAHFLYRVELGQPAGAGARVTQPGHWEMASRLSYLLWRTMPDPALFAAAETGKLGTREEIAAQVRRMMADPKARAVTSDFGPQWLNVLAVAGVVKDPKRYPRWSAAAAGLMVEEARRLVDHVVWDRSGTFADLFTAPFTFVDPTLAGLYGIPFPAGATGGFRKVEPPQPRAGILTLGGLMSVLAKAAETHPIKRGVYAREQLLCQGLEQPPATANITFPPASPTQTMRDRLAGHSQNAFCATCHKLIDPIGLGLENFDAVGAFRAQENGRMIDVKGEVAGLAGAGSSASTTFDGPAELGRVLGASEEARSCFVRSWFRYGYGRTETPADACTLELLRQRTAAAGGRVRDLIAALTETDAFLYRPVVAGGAP